MKEAILNVDIGKLHSLGFNIDSYDDKYVNLSAINDVKITLTLVRKLEKILSASFINVSPLIFKWNLNYYNYRL